jgi:S1-C subfamily serine protease
MNARLISVVACALLAGSSVAAQAQDLASVFQEVKTSVVIVRTTEKELAPWGQGQKVSISGQGSGVLISRDGQVLTASHVVQAADQVVVEFHNGETIEASVVSSAPQADVALLQLSRRPSQARAAPLGDSGNVAVGQQVFVVGAPFGISYTLTVGHISARRQPNALVNGLEEAELFQTDAAINQGNSGGPMFNLAGEVIGIVSHILTQSGGFEGLGFVVTADTARKLLFERRSIWTGFEGFELRDDLARILNLPQPIGVLVQRVAEGSPAARLGLRPGTIKAVIGEETLLLGGDVILDAMGITLTDRESAGKIRDAVGQLRPGGDVTLTVLRDGKLIELASKLP